MKPSLLAVTIATLFAVPAAHADLLYFDVGLTGDQEVNASGDFNQGDADGFGVAKLVIDTAANTIDWEILVMGIDTPLTGAHIHNAAAGANGPILVDFDKALSGDGLADADLASVVANPSDFYVNLHNGMFQAGAIRGQICDPYRVVVEPVPLPAAAWLFGSGLLGLIGIARRRA
jgi:hypothetical protein